MSNTTGGKPMRHPTKPITGSDQFEAAPPMAAARMAEFEGIIRRELELVGEDLHQPGEHVRPGAHVARLLLDPEDLLEVRVAGDQLAYVFFG